MGAAIVLGVAALLLYGPVGADYSEREDVLAFVDGLVSEHGFKRQELLMTFREAKHLPLVIESISKPKERTLKWYEYRKIFLQEPRIDQGVAFWGENEVVLDAAQATFQVAPEYIVAIIGVETYFGRIMGSHRVLDALSTLAFDYPPRSAFFRGQLAEFLLLVREEGRPIDSYKGSYAGAMGYGQFIPSSFRNFAVDFDGDGARDIWGNKADAIGSVANYIAEHNWRPAAPVVTLVDVTEPARVAEIVNEGLELKRTISELRALGVAAPGLADEAKAGLIRMELQNGAEYWLTLHNFYVISRYNHSRMYALAVHQLSQAIKARREAVAQATTGACCAPIAALAAHSATGLGLR